MIGKENYYQVIKDVDFSKLDEDMNAMKVQVDKITFNGSDWTAYENDENVKETFDLYFQALELELEEATIKVEKKPVPKEDKKVIKQVKTTSSTKIQEKDIIQGARFKIKGGTIFIVEKVIVNENGQTEVRTSHEGGEKGLYNDLIEDLVDFLNEEQAKKMPNPSSGSGGKSNIPKEQTAKKSIPRKNASRKTTTVKNRSTKPKPNPNAKKVEAFSEEIKFIKRYVNMDGKAKNQNQIRLFISALQKAIRERRIRKASRYAKEITDIQDSLIKLHGKFKNDSQLLGVSLSQRKKADYLKILGRQVEMLSVRLIKSYINLQGKVITNKKATNLYNRIANAINGGKITARDKYWQEVNSTKDQLKTFVKKNPNSGILIIEPRALNGLEGIVGCPCEVSLGGVSNVPDDLVVNSMDLKRMKFAKLGLTGKWGDFIGDPSPNFSVMIFGRPKFGKSIMAVGFAGHLARNHGRVLYVAKEEGIDTELQDKLESVAHPNLDAVGSLPNDLSEWEFIFLDSVNKLRLTPEMLEELRERYPDKAFISIFQTTKDGLFRGSQEFMHDMDVVIEVPEKGKAVQYGRYNQGGEMDIFETSLDGVKKKVKTDPKLS